MSMSEGMYNPKHPNSRQCTMHYGEVVMGGGTFVSIRLCQLCLSFYQRPNISDRFVNFSFSFYPRSNIPDTFVGDEMNSCQSRSALFHER